VLAALSSVGYVVPFASDTAEPLVAELRPDVYVKGGDYDLDALPEARIVNGYGGEVRLLAYVDGRSTTEVVHRWRVAGST
jgi:glycerol-3-phosphate cytidylyltransferase